MFAIFFLVVAFDQKLTVLISLFLTWSRCRAGLLLLVGTRWVILVYLSQLLNMLPLGFAEGSDESIPLINYFINLNPTEHEAGHSLVETEVRSGQPIR